MGPFDDADPFAIFTAPPPDETPAQRTARETKDRDAQKISDAIDEEIKLQRAAMKKEKDILKLLLLGQAESGKSTTLKNFRLKYAPEAWERERGAWRAVVQLNLVQSVLKIMDALQAELDGDVPMMSNADDFGTIYGAPIEFTDRHHLFQLRLAPLRRVEVDLKRRLGAGTDDVVVCEPLPANPFDYSSHTSAYSRQEVVVRSWKDALESGGSKNNTESDMEATTVIAGCKADIIALWEDECIQTMLKKRNMRLEDSGGFYLRDLARVAARNYEPSDADIVQCRLRTIGVQEYRVDFGISAIREGYGREMIIYDVGGCRTSRAAWLPYFEGIHAIVFLAPISCFDERLAEDPRINRLEDSFLLWTSICSSKLLAKTTMVLFLNKCDLLKKKIRRGIVVKEHLPSYGDRSNDTKTVIKYLRDKFKDILKQQSPHPRVSYSFPTSVVDTKATAVTLVSVRDSIFREHLSQSNLL